MMIPSTKIELRQYYREERSRLTPEQKEEMNKGLITQLNLAIEVPVKSMMTFSSIPQWGEPDAGLLTDFLKKKFSPVRVAYPKILDESGNMEAILPAADAPMVPGKWNIPEPENGILLDPHDLELVLVPLLAFDRRGQRVGYGRGYYDRFLQRCNSGTIRLGISFFEPIPHIDDTDYFDVPLSRCITPFHLYEF